MYITFSCRISKHVLNVCTQNIAYYFDIMNCYTPCKTLLASKSVQNRNCGKKKAQVIRYVNFEQNNNKVSEIFKHKVLLAVSALYLCYRAELLKSLFTIGH